MNEPGDADWNNLMGYSHRRAKKPDYAAAEKYYAAALQIDPKHKGALEYSGEMYLVLGQLEMAEQRLAALDQICSASCFEYGLLKKAIDDYKANGNKYVQASP
jgi:tetratricopeptide (TPR) repeat protein